MCFSDGAQIWNSLPFAFPLLLRVPPYDGSCHEYHFCPNKSFVATKDIFHLNKSIPILLVYFAATKLQAYFCRNKHEFVATKQVFCRDKTFVKTNTRLSRQIFVATKFCRDKYHFVAINCLSQQAYFCHYKRPVLS